MARSAHLPQKCSIYNHVTSASRLHVVLGWRLLAQAARACSALAIMPFCSVFGRSGCTFSAADLRGGCFGVLRMPFCSDLLYSASFLLCALFLLCFCHCHSRAHSAVPALEAVSHTQQCQRSWLFLTLSAASARGCFSHSAVPALVAVSHTQRCQHLSLLLSPCAASGCDCS